MRILILTFCIICSCSSSNQKTDIKVDELIYKIKKKRFHLKYRGWKIYPREVGSDQYYFDFYYPHSDTVEFQYDSSGSVLEWSKYGILSFAINDLDNLTCLTGEQELCDSVLFNGVSNYSDGYLLDIKSEFMALGVDSFTSYTWMEGMSFFNVGDNVLMYLPENVDTRGSEKIKDYSVFGKGWYFKYSH